MKNPNGLGTVEKLSGKRRHPYMARVTIGWSDDGSRQIRQAIGYYSTRKEAVEALMDFARDPYDLSTKCMTFADVYNTWSEDYFKKLKSPSSIRTVTSAYNHCKMLHDMRFESITVEHLEKAIETADCSDNTKARIKSLYNLIYKWAVKHKLAKEDLAQLCDSVKKPKPQIIRIPFSDQEIAKLKELKFPFADMVLVGIYSGWRPQELAVLKVANIDLEVHTMVGGMKTEAGTDRLVPIHSAIYDLVKARYEEAVEMKSEYLFNDPDGQQGTHLTYDKYRGRFKKVMLRIGADHKPHDTRHTYITRAKMCGIDEYVLKLIVGHCIDDITESTYTHRTIEELKTEMEKLVI